MTKIEQITQLANQKIHEKFPMLVEPIKKFMTEAILEAEKKVKGKKTGD